MLKKSLVALQNGLCKESQTISCNGLRISLLTPSLFRIEKQNNNNFCDLPTQSVWFRDIETVEFQTKTHKNILTITTSAIVLTIDTSAKRAIMATIIAENRSSKICNAGNLHGTCRTLDCTFGKVPLGKGLISTSGVAVYDDSNSLVLNAEGNIIPRDNVESDTYIFAYGYNYRKCIQDLYRICGAVPQIPRYALGVWWSRYRAYSQDEYQSLMQRFIDEKIPLSVATVDMDWHWTDCNKQFGTNFPSRLACDNPTTGGWTGYSWNTELFPDYRQFLNWLQERNLKVTLNLHPKSGFRWFEDCYKEMATAMGIDPQSKETVEFDVSSDKFWNSYFDIAHKPYEKDGINFWWIDWQQGKSSQIKGLDPLWALNHYHFLDNAENGQLPLILSRYAGVGSHRYPLGFSGDTSQSWKVLDFQPYFTANANNVGYTWWSHDIGGHHMGKRDDELYLRWLQWGVFSPIMRFHSTSHDLLGKEPWRYSGEINSLAKDFIRFRHKLIPYIYSMNYRTHTEGIALLEPMYYSYPQEKNSYLARNEYFFGSELIVCPITQKTNKKSCLASCTMFIPEGRWTDIFNKTIYNKTGLIDVYRDISTIPVLIKAGGIVPISLDAGNSVANPKTISIIASRGNGQFKLFEDNSQSDFEQRNASTKFSIAENEKERSIEFIIDKVQGDVAVLPQLRSYTINIIDIVHVDSWKILVNDKEVFAKNKNNNEFSQASFTVDIADIHPTDTVKIIIKNYAPLENPSDKDCVIDILSRWQKNTVSKRTIYHPIKHINDSKILKRKLLHNDNLPKSIRNALKEIFER